MNQVLAEKLQNLLKKAEQKKETGLPRSQEKSEEKTFEEKPTPIDLKGQEFYGYNREGKYVVTEEKPTPSKDLGHFDILKLVQKLNDGNFMYKDQNQNYVAIQKQKSLKHVGRNLKTVLVIIYIIKDRSGRVLKKGEVEPRVEASPRKEQEPVVLMGQPLYRWENQQGEVVVQEEKPLEKNFDVLQVRKRVAENIFEYVDSRGETLEVKQETEPREKTLGKTVIICTETKPSGEKVEVQVQPVLNKVAKQLAELKKQGMLYKTVDERGQAQIHKDAPENIQNVEMLILKDSESEKLTFIDMKQNKVEVELEQFEDSKTKNIHDKIGYKLIDKETGEIQKGEIAQKEEEKPEKQSLDLRLKELVGRKLFVVMNKEGKPEVKHQVSEKDKANQIETLNVLKTVGNRILILNPQGKQFILHKEGDNTQLTSYDDETGEVNIEEILWIIDSPPEEQKQGQSA